MTPTDLDAILRAFLLGQAALVAVAGPRIYLTADPPTGYDTAADPARPTTTGPAVVLTTRGGRVGPTSVLLDVTYQARCYGATEPVARDLDARLLAALHDQRHGRMKAARCTVTGQATRDPTTGWFFFLSTWQVTAVIA